MKSKSIMLGLFAVVFSMFLFTSCGDKKNADSPATQEENSVSQEKESASDEKTISSVEYQCPMDCEHGKTYHEAGSCPVCKMDLKALNDGGSMTCKQHKDGNCSCDRDKCKCTNCKQHS